MGSEGKRKAEGGEVFVNLFSLQWPLKDQSWVMLILRIFLSF